MSGIYIHIPFCKSKCLYCNFFSVTNMNNVEKYFDTLILEINQRRNELLPERVKTIYIGGGTPSCVDIKYIEKICSELARHIDFNEIEEFTIECNPDDVNENYVPEIKRLGINRVSFGVQTFNDDVLKVMNRRHSSSQICKAVELSKNAGIENISVDLIYGFPSIEWNNWKNDVEEFLKLDVDHLSSYCLQYEKGSRIWKNLESGKITPKSDEVCNEEYDYLTARMRESGYEHYEISNFARNGKYSQHNSAYWFGIKYFGYGAAAHSYDGESRYWNSSSLAGYFAQFKKQKFESEAEKLSDKDKFNEFIMLGLRTMWGVDENKLSLFPERFVKNFIREVEVKIKFGEIVKKNNSFVIPEDKMIISDKIISDLFVD